MLLVVHLPSYTPIQISIKMAQPILIFYYRKDELCSFFKVNITALNEYLRSDPPGGQSGTAFGGLTARQILGR